jgi:hypothetical protein
MSYSKGAAFDLANQSYRCGPDSFLLQPVAFCT